ncbi:MAG: hypothetical protein HUU37_07640 [Bdellovibrionales bacterium]|nr:hypothetical protein [Bdellovibrionales bacterium]
MKNLMILSLALLAPPTLHALTPKVEMLPAMAPMNCDPNPGSCRVVDQSGTIESWECRNSEGNIRCYADVEYQNGTRLRVWGGCVSSYGDCWSTGSSAVNPCN